MKHILCSLIALSMIMTADIPFALSQPQIGIGEACRLCPGGTLKKNDFEATIGQTIAAVHQRTGPSR